MTAALGGCLVMGELRTPNFPKFGHFLTSVSAGDRIPEHPKTPPCNRGTGGDRVAALPGGDGAA